MAGGGPGRAALTVWALGRTHGRTPPGGGSTAWRGPGAPTGTRGSGMCQGFMQRVTRAGIKPARWGERYGGRGGGEVTGDGEGTGWERGRGSEVSRGRGVSSCAGHPARVTFTPKWGVGTRGAGTNPPQQRPGWGSVSAPPVAARAGLGKADPAPLLCAR